MGLSQKCAMCRKNITFRYRSMQEWNVSGDLCGDCYGKKLTEYYISDDRRDIVKQ